jgi:hypothetical protein
MGVNLISNLNFLIITDSTGILILLSKKNIYIKHHGKNGFYF